MSWFRSSGSNNGDDNKKRKHDPDRTISNDSQQLKRVLKVQLFDSLDTESTASFMRILESTLQSGYALSSTRPSGPGDISTDTPVLVLCQNHSRIATDIKRATEGLADIPKKLVAVIIIHVKAKKHLPTIMTSDSIEDDSCKTFGLLVDFAFRDNALYDCDMNTRGREKLKMFLDGHMGASEHEVRESCQLPDRNHNDLQESTCTPSKRGAHKQTTLHVQDRKRDNGKMETKPENKVQRPSQSVGGSARFVGASANATLSNADSSPTVCQSRGTEKKKNMHTVQLFDSLHTKTTASFMRILESTLQSGYGLSSTRPSGPGDISRDTPVLVLCHNYSRIATDIKQATEGLADIPKHLVAVIIIHVKAKKHLPTIMTSDSIEDDSCKTFGLLVDFAFRDNELYDCDMNTRGREKLKTFLDGHCIEPGNTNHQEQDSDLSVPSEPKRTRRTERGGHVNYPLQMYIHPEIDATQLMEVPESFHTVSSVVDLSQQNMWIVVCPPGSVEKYILAGKSTNAKVLVLLDQSPSELSIKRERNDILKIEVGIQEIAIAKIKEEIRYFLEEFITIDVTGIFDASSTRLEVYIEDDAKDMGESHLGLNGRTVSAVTDFTKQDPRILWLIVCKEGSPLVELLDQASPSNAKVVLVLDNGAPELGYTPEERPFLLILRMRPGSLPQQLGNVKEDVVQFMKTVQKQLLMDPLERVCLTGQTALNGPLERSSITEPRQTQGASSSSRNYCSIL